MQIYLNHNFKIASYHQIYASDPKVACFSFFCEYNFIKKTNQNTGSRKGE